MNGGVAGAARGRGWQRLPSTLVNFYVVSNPRAWCEGLLGDGSHAATAQLTG